MDSPKKYDRYEARILIENEVILKKTGNNIDELKVYLIEKCDQEHSGTEGEIIERASGTIIYRCHKQTIIDK